jgi:hypothetical protein
VQILAARNSGLIRKLVPASTVPSRGGQHHLEVLAKASRAAPHAQRLPLSYTSSECSQSAGIFFIRRSDEPSEDRDHEPSLAVRDAKAEALISWCPSKTGKSVLKASSQPHIAVGVRAGAKLAKSNFVDLYEGLRNARLILNPDSGHGVSFQYPVQFFRRALAFLNPRIAIRRGDSARRFAMGF